MPLTLAPAGIEQVIKKVGGSEGLKSHLQDIGFVVGARVTVVSTLGGNLIVYIKNSRVAISREMAGKILV